MELLRAGSQGRGSVECITRTLAWFSSLGALIRKARIAFYEREARLRDTDMVALRFDSSTHGGNGVMAGCAVNGANGLPAFVRPVVPCSVSLMPAAGTVCEYCGCILWCWQIGHSRKACFAPTSHKFQ